MDYGGRKDIVVPPYNTRYGGADKITVTFARRTGSRVRGQGPGQGNREGLVQIAEALEGMRRECEKLMASRGFDFSTQDRVRCLLVVGCGLSCWWLGSNFYS
jgi:hypothetical protein